MSVWQIFYGDTAEAMIKETKSNLSIQILKYFRENKMTQKALSEKLNISQPRVSNLLRGHLEKFSIEALLGYGFQLGLVSEVRTEA